MRWILAFHLIAVICWFAGLFYLPRLFVYHSQATDRISLERFKIMERRLYYGITWPSAILTVALGGWLLQYKAYYYFHAGWMIAKLALVFILIIYHLACGHYLKQFKTETNEHTHIFYRFFNEIPTVLLIAIVLLAIIQP